MATRYFSPAAQAALERLIAGTYTDADCAVTADHLRRYFDRVRASKGTNWLCMNTRFGNSSDAFTLVRDYIAKLPEAEQKDYTLAAYVLNHALSKHD